MGGFWRLCVQGSPGVEVSVDAHVDAHVKAQVNVNVNAHVNIENINTEKSRERREVAEMSRRGGTRERLREKSGGGTGIRACGIRRDAATRCDVAVRRCIAVLRCGVERPARLVEWRGSQPFVA